MDYEEVANFSNFTFDEDIVPGRAAAEIAREIIFIIFCLVGVCADGAIIFAILRFKRMRTIPHILLANWAIADLCSLLVAPSGYQIISVLDHIAMSPEFMCGLLHFGAVLHLTVVLFVIIVSADWCLAAYFPKSSEKVRSYHRYIIGTIWITSLLCCGLTTGLCLADEDSYLALNLLLASYWVMLIVNIVLQSSRAVSKYYLKKPIDYPSQMLTLTTAFIACWSLAFFVSLVTDFLRYHPLLAVMVELFLFSNSIVNFTILYLWNKDFQACVLQTINRSDDGYDDAALDFENPVYKNSIVKDKTQVKLSFDKQDELLITNEY